MGKRSKTEAKHKIAKPSKPYPEFPLTAHNAGYWCKSIKGKIHYFGRWGKVVNGEMVRLPDDGWQAALDKYNEEREDLYAGRKPRKNRDGLTMVDLCNRFLTAKKHLLETGELSPRTFHDYKAATDRLIEVIGKNRLVEDLAADDFGKLRAEIAKKRGPVSLGNEIGRIRSVCKFAFDAGLIEKPVKYGPMFKKPSKKTLRKEKQKNGSKMFEPEELRQLIENTDGQLRAMILLGLNCGFGNSDIGNLPISAVNLETGWIDFPRPKTAVERRCPLWKKTVEAIKEVITNRPEPKSEDHSGLVFITKYGQPWMREGDVNKSKSDNPISAEFRKLCKKCNLYKARRGYYALRHCFQTIGEEAGETATRFLMGHTDDSMSANYRQRISDERLKAVTDHVHQWLFPPNENPK